MRRKFSFILPKRKVNGNLVVGRSRSIIRSSNREKLKTTDLVTHPEVINPPQTRGRKKREGNLFSACLKFFSGFASSYIIRKRFGNQRILQELQRNTHDNEAYGGFFGKPDNWIISSLPEMNLVDPGCQFFTFQPECLLGVGGQGCVFLGKLTDHPPSSDKSYAFKIRARTKSAMNSGTSKTPGRRRSPNFRIINHELKEDNDDDDDGGGKEECLNFVDDLQQESLHREAVAAFRVHMKTQSNPKPLLYGYSAKLDYEIFVMDIMDFTLNDFVRGTTWKTRMDCMPEVWDMVRESFDNCHQGGIVHYDIKPENIGIRITNKKLEYGLIDFGISKTQGYGLERYCKGPTLYRAPGTVDYMSPRTHAWKPMSWMDDFLSSFFTIYSYAVSEGKSSYEKMEGVKKIKYPPTTDDRKNINPASAAIYCLRRPPWTRFPYGINHALKKKQNETIVKEEISLSMIKIHALSEPRSLEDIISILLNLDGFLDDTMDVKGLSTEEERRLFSVETAQFLRNVLARTFGRLGGWWLEFAAEVRRLVDEFWEKTPEDQRASLFISTSLNVIDAHLPDHEDLDGLIQDSTCGRKILETVF